MWRFNSKLGTRINLASGLTFAKLLQKIVFLTSSLIAYNPTPIVNKEGLTWKRISYRYNDQGTVTLHSPDAQLWSVCRCIVSGGICIWYGICECPIGHICGCVSRFEWDVGVSALRAAVEDTKDIDLEDWLIVCSLLRKPAE